MGMITGSGRVNLLSGRIWRYRVGFGSAMRAHPRIRWAAAPAGWATQVVRAVSPAGPRHGFGPKAEFNEEILFFFKSIL
jgi:hypothetical protein